MKLNEALGITVEQLEMMDIVNIDLSPNVDVPRFLDLTKMTDVLGDESLSHTFFINMDKIIKNPHMLKKDKISAISKESGFTKMLGLGFSTGAPGSHPRGAERNNVLSLIEFVERVVNEEDRYQNFGLMKYALKGLGKDGLSDMIGNLMEDLLEAENERLIKNIEEANLNERKLLKYSENFKISINSISGKKSISYNGVSKKLTNITWTISNEDFESNHINKLISYARSEDMAINITNESLREKMQVIATYKLVPNDVQGWKEFVDSVDIVSKNDIEAMEKIDSSVPVNNVEDLSRSILLTSSKDMKDESVYQNLFRVALNMKGIKYYSGTQVTSDEASGEIDIYVEPWNDMIEIKLVDSFKTLDAAIIQCIEYSEDWRFKGSNVIIAAIVSKGNIKKFSELLIENHYSKKIKVVFLKHNFYTASKFSKVIPSDATQKQIDSIQSEAVKMVIANKIDTVEIEPSQDEKAKEPKSENNS